MLSGISYSICAYEIKQKPERFDQDGFPGAGLTGKRGQPVFKFQLQGFDHREVFNRERFQHDQRTPQENFSCSKSK